MFKPVAAASMLLLTAGLVYAGPSEIQDGSLEAAITNFHVVDEGQVLRGARPQTSGIEALAKAGVKTVIDLQGGDLESRIMRPLVKRMEPGETRKAIEQERKDSESNGIKFYNFPLNSMHHVTAAEGNEIGEVLGIMHDSAAQPVYIHCEHGKDRTGLVVAMYRVRYDGWSIKDAHDEMIRDGHSGLADHLVTGEMDEYYYQVAPVLQKLYEAEHPKAE